jgi:hypothetical protein
MTVDTMYTLFPLGTDGTFPDNGILSQAYDSRVSQNDMLRIGMQLMHQADAYYREEDVLGGGIYTWNPDFILMIQQSLADNKIANFSKKQRILFNAYIALLTDGITGNEPEEVIALDTYLGGL